MLLIVPQLPPAELRPLTGACSPAASCKRVLTTQIGFVTVLVTKPARAAAERCTYEFSRPSLKVVAMICLPLPYVKKLIERAGMTPTRVGPRPMKRARGDSCWYMSLHIVQILFQRKREPAHRRICPVSTKLYNTPPGRRGISTAADPFPAPTTPKFKFA